MTANQTTATKSIGATIDSLFDVDAIVKAAGALDGNGGSGEIGRVLRVASERIGAIAIDLDEIDTTMNKRNTSGDDVFTAVCSLADSVVDESDSAKNVLLAIQHILKAAKERKPQDTLLRVE